jgi:ABC-type transport system involved in multi-copper enzyme maturation permease subunit
MLGAVLHQELLLGSRRQSLHVFRWAFAVWLVCVITFLYVQFQAECDELRQQQYAQASRGIRPSLRFVQVRISVPAHVGGRFTDAFLVQELFLLLLATPAFVAGAITDEKRRGTLQQLLTTDLEVRHILMGKLLGRTAQVALIAVVGVPPFALLAGFAGCSALAVLLMLLVLVGPLFFLAAGSMLASVLCRQTRDAVLALYVVGVGVALIVWHFHMALAVLDPRWALEPIAASSGSIDLLEAARRIGLCTACYTIAAGLCIGIAAWRLWPAFRRDLEGGRPSTEGQWWPTARAPIGDDPILWRERHVEGLAPSPTLRRIPTWAGVTVVGLATVCSSVAMLLVSLSPGVTLGTIGVAIVTFDATTLYASMPDAHLAFTVQGLVVMLLASLVVGVRCSGSITGERERMTWEGALATPLSVRQILHAKLWGTLWASVWYLLAYAAPALTLAALGGPAAMFWTALWLVVTLLAMYYIGSAALWCSARAKSSWRSLLGTLAAGYLGGIALYLLTTPIWAIIGVLVALFLQGIDHAWGTNTAAKVSGSLAAYEVPVLIASSIALGAIFLFMARTFQTHALRWVADRERARHWDQAPVYRRPRRSAPWSPAQR